jgi:hypothetical protein
MDEEAELERKVMAESESKPMAITESKTISVRVTTSAKPRPALFLPRIEFVGCGAIEPLGFIDPGKLGFSE